MRISAAMLYIESLAISRLVTQKLGNLFEKAGKWADPLSAL
jgi:hypothetical protein